MTDNSNSRVSQLENEISTLKELLGNMEQQLAALYTEKDKGINSDLETDYQTNLLKNEDK